MKALGFDIGATKISWGLFDGDTLLHTGTVPTPSDRQAFLGGLIAIIKEQRPDSVGIGIAGIVSATHADLVVCPNVPTLSHLELVRELQELGGPIATLDNDARCALIGEVWQGSASEYTSAVLLTIGTGIGGAVMQKGRVLPHPQDVGLEIGHLLVDPTDVFPAASGSGTVEALLGGRNLQERLGIDLADERKRLQDGDPDSATVWDIISGYFHQCLEAVYAEYRCKAIIIGGRGAKELDVYLGTQEPPCPVIAAKLGERAGLYGAARLALDIYEDSTTEWYRR